MADEKNWKTEAQKNQMKNRPLKKSLLERLSSTRNSRTIRAFSMLLAAITVFGTTYGMILPAITVDQESAEEMPGIYLEEDYAAGADYEEGYEENVQDAADEGAYEDGIQDAADEAAYEDGIQDAADEGAYEDGIQDAADETAYEDGIQDPADEAVYEDGEGVPEEESRDEIYTYYENADDDRIDSAADDTAVYEEQESDVRESADSSSEVSNHTYQETRLETAVPVQTALLGDVTVRIDYTSAAMIPDGSMLSASEVDTNAETEEEAAQKRWRLEHLENAADDLLAEIDSDWSWNDASFFDVELTDPEGNVLQPGSQIYLTVYFTNPVYTDKVRFVRFYSHEETEDSDVETPELMDPVDLGYTEDGGVYAGVFLVDSLSPFGVLSGDSLQAMEEEMISAEADSVLTESETDSMEEAVPAESEAELAVDAAQTESETESVAEAVMAESDSESAAEAVLTESTTESAAEPVLEEAVEYPARVFREATENVNVTVLAPEGAFPADTIMTVQDVSGGVINDITEAVSDDSTTVSKVHAVDITFTDGKGNEIELLVPVKMTIAAEEKQETEDTLVVHVSDEGNVEQVEDVIISDSRGASRARLTMEAGEPVSPAETDSDVQTDSAAEVMPESVVENVEGMEDHAVVADAFSVYAIVYTVDFHWEVDGKEYAFSIPGDGFVRFSDLVEVLGITEKGSHSDTDTTTTAGDVEVSEDTRKFISNVENVEFSSPELVEVSKVDAETTVYELKGNLGLDCEYSPDLSEEQIAEINAQTVEAGDWVLISVHPFSTEEELTVTMKNGEVFTIRVTDYQISTNVLTADGKNYKITVTYEDDAEIPDGTQLKALEIEPDSDAFIQRLGQAWSEVNKEYFEVEEMRMHYDEGMGDLPDVHLVNLDDARFFDISLVYKGKVIEPAAPVHVDITYVDGLDVSENSIMGVAHFAESGVELIKDVKTITKDNSVIGFSYEQAGFSDTGTYVGRETFDEVSGPEIAPVPEKTEYPLLKAAADTQDGEGKERGEESVDNEDHTDLEKPKGTKTLTPNKSSNGNNDGTYTLTLSVSGTSKSSTETIVSKSNVLIVMDRSSSMINNYVYTYTEYNGSHQSNTTYYGVDGDTYFQLFYNASNGKYYRNNWYGTYYYDEYKGTRYTRTQKTRLAEEQTALSQLLNQMLSKNGTGTTEDGVSLEDIIEVSVISFADQRYSGKDTEVDWTTDYDTLMAGVNKDTYTSGTNWEDALKYALEVANAKQAEPSQEGEEMYIIFLTDGEPTAVYGESGGPKHYNNVGGGYVVAYDAAKDDAMALVNEGYHLYNIFTYGTDEDYGYMVRLTNYAYSNGENDTTDEDTDAVKQYFTNAKTTEKLLTAFQNIFSLVSNSAAYGKVSITDGLTTDAMTTTLVHGRAEGYKYTVTGALGELYSVTATGSAENPSVVFTINGHSYPGEKKSTIIDGVSYDYWSYTAGEGDAAVEYKMTLADVSEDGTLKWDLTGIGTLMDGYTYSAGFVVWPDQDAYDYVAALNNGLQGYTWDSNAETYEDLRTSKGYEKGGVERFPSIVRYENGTFAVLTNTEQKVQYSIVETKEVDGETTIEYAGPYEFELPEPDPMPLTGTASQLEKVWNINRDPSILYKYLYELKDDDDNPVAFDIGFVIVQDGEEYKEVHLPGAATVTADGVSYDWSAYSEDDLVEYNGKTFSKRWSQDFSIPTGLMLSTAQMEARGLDKDLYTSYSYGGTQYYVLEAGHDFMIGEPSVGYEFDFDAPVYHPMLVDGVLMDVKFSTEGGTKHISAMEALEIEAGTGKSALSVFNTLRGYINLKKRVIDQNGASLETDDKEFTFEVTLTNALPVFEGESIPWYGINGLYYHDAEGNYYQAEYVNGNLQLTTEEGGPYPAKGTAFNPDIIDEQTVTYTIDGEEKTVTISGNQMTPTDGTVADGYKKVEARVKITQAETLYIANVPVNTQYSIQEIVRDGYQVVDIERKVGSGTAAGAGNMNTGIVEGEIAQNTETLVTYTNKCLITDISIQKTDTHGEGLEGAVFQLKKVGSDGHSESAASDIESVSGLTTITKTANGETRTFASAFESDGAVQTINGLPDGTYRLYEVIAPAGYITTFRYIEFTIEDRVMKNVKTNTDDNSKLDFTEASGNNLALLKIANTPGAALPHTGGSGTTLLYIFGLMLTGLASAGLITRKRRRVSA